MKVVFKIFEWTFFAVLLCAIVVIASPFLLSKQSIASYSVVSGSMEPTILINTLTFVQQKPFSSLQKGDIIAFTDPTNKDRVILHRIYAVKQTQGNRTLQTKGDHNRFPDGWQVTSPMVKGKLFYAVPYVGKLSEWLKSPIGFGIMIGIPALLFIYLSIMQIRQGIKDEIAKGIAKNESKSHSSSPNPSILIVPILALGLLAMVPSVYAIKFGHVSLTFAVSTAVISITPTLTPTPSTTVTPTPKPTITPTSTPSVTPTVSVTPAPSGSPCGNTNVVISGNGAGSTNTVNVTNNCPSTTVNQSNNTTIINNISTVSTTGGNTISGNTSGNITVTTGSVTSTTSITTSGSSNTTILP